MTRLPPVRMLCPSLGTQLLMPDPRALQSYILYLTTPGTPRMNVPIVSRLGLAFAILMTFIIPPIYPRLGSEHVGTDVQTDMARQYLFLGHFENSLSGRFRPEKSHSKLKKNAFFSELPHRLKHLPWSDPTSIFFMGL
jgi:hypothetical protein